MGLFDWLWGKKPVEKELAREETILERIARVLKFAKEDYANAMKILKSGYVPDSNKKLHLIAHTLDSLITLEEEQVAREKRLGNLGIAKREHDEAEYMKTIRDAVLHITRGDLKYEGDVRAKLDRLVREIEETIREVKSERQAAA